MKTLLRNNVWTIVHDGDVCVKRINDDTELLRLSPAAAEDLAQELISRARQAREMTKANSIQNIVTDHYYDNIDGYEGNEPCLHEGCGKLPLAHQPRRSVLG